MERKDVNVGRFIGQVLRDTPKLMNFPLTSERRWWVVFERARIPRLSRERERPRPRARVDR